MATVPKPLCSLDDTWEDALPAFKSHLQTLKTWSCACIEGVDTELLLSAPEVMDPKTDSGFGCEAIYSLDYLLSGAAPADVAIPSAATLTAEADLVNMMDLIHVKELHFLDGYALGQSYLAVFPYFLRMAELKQQNPVLHVYCRGVLRTLDYVLQAVFSTSIRSDEEFFTAPPELQQQLPEGETVEQLLAELEEAAAKSASPAVAARLRFRKQWLSIFHLLLHCKRRSDVEAAASLCEEARALLQSAEYRRTAEPTVAAGFLREKEINYWVSVITPNKPQPTPTFAAVVAAYDTALRQVASLQQLLHLASLTEVTEFVEQLGAAKPLLPIRSLAVIVIFSKDPLESFLYGTPLPQRLLGHIAREHGAPIYLQVFENDESVVESVVKYRVHKTMDPLKITPDQMLYLRQQTRDAVQHWALEASRVYLSHLETMLCNRGLAHSRLMNSMLALAQLQERSYAVDMNVFLAPQVQEDAATIHKTLTPAAQKSKPLPELESDLVRLTTVLTLVANAQVLHVMELLVRLHFELQLLAPGELLPALWYLNFTQRAQAENDGLLHPSSATLQLIPETRINKKTKVPVHNLALTSRGAGAPDVARATVLEAGRWLTDATFLAACLYEAQGLIDLTSDNSPAALLTAENMFNHRFMRCFGAVQNPPFVTYYRCASSKPEFDKKDTAALAKYAKHSSEVAVGAAEKLKALLAAAQPAGGDHQQARRALLREAEGMEHAARATAASLSSFAAMAGDAELIGSYAAKAEFMGVNHDFLTFSLHKK